jgi:hypothetical protein
MRKLATDLARLLGACVGFIGAWVAIVAFVEVTGVPFGIPGIIIVSALGVYLGAKLGRRALNRYS